MKKRPSTTIENAEKILELVKRHGLDYINRADSNSLRILHHLQRYIFISTQIKDGVSVLDVGTGEAISLYQIQKKLPNVKLTGIDIDKEVLNIAKKNIPGATFLTEVSDYTDFDVVICCELIGNGSIDSDYDFLSQFKKVKTVFVSIPCYNGRKKQKYFSRTYNSESFKQLIKTVFKGSEIEFYGQLYPNNCINKEDVGVLLNSDLINCDFIMAKIVS